MGNTSVSMLCSLCQTSLKRQVLGSNVFYYCRKCGCVSSEAYFSEEINLFSVKKSISGHRLSSVTDLKLSEDVQNYMAET
jgi:transcription initiation factor TFIIIB Brf1 subunit/transcription initiation factor TFIIB